MSLYASAWVCMCTYGCLGMCVHVSVTDRDLGVQGRDSRGQVRSPSRLANSASPCPLRSWADSQAFSLCPPPCPAGWTGSWGPAALPATHGLFSVPPLGRPPCRPPSQPGAPGPTQPEGEEFPESRDCGPHLGDINSKRTKQRVVIWCQQRKPWGTLGRSGSCLGPRLMVRKRGGPGAPAHGVGIRKGEAAVGIEWHLPCGTEACGSPGTRLSYQQAQSVNPEEGGRAGTHLSHPQRQAWASPRATGRQEASHVLMLGWGDLSPGTHRPGGIWCGAGTQPRSF